MLATLHGILDSIPYPITVGCVGIFLGFVVTGLASPLKSKADRARKARRPENRAPATKLRIRFWLTLLGGALLMASGTWLTLNGARLDAEAKAKEAKQLLEQARKENEQMRKDFEAKFQMVLFALNAAKAEQLRLLTDEKIKSYSKDVLQWADDFYKRRPDKQRELEQAKIAVTQQEIQISGDSMSLFSFTLQVIQQIINAYEKQSGEKFKITLPPLPQNLYDAGVNSISRTIQFAGDARWQFSVNASSPAQESNPPNLYVNFNSTDGRSGSLWMRRFPDGKKFNIGVNGTLPMPNSATLAGEYDMRDYEETIRRIFQRLIEAQLSQPATPTPTATPSP
jgi:hypothetical protein